MRNWQFKVLVAAVIAVAGFFARDGEGKGVDRPSSPHSFSREAPARPEPKNRIVLIEGECVAVLDGDTVTVLDSEKVQHRIRLLGIDAPEKAQAFGMKSKQHLSDLVYRKRVQVEIHGSDRYGRAIGKILVDGADANLEQVKAGLAWWYEAFRKNQTLEDQELYSDAEKAARRARKGVWGDESPTPPWEFRKKSR